MFTSGLYAQLGIKAGINMANEIKSFSQVDINDGFFSNNLTGYHFGIVYQKMPKKNGLGVEIGALLSQKGSTFSYDSIDATNSTKEGYRELNYLEVPLNLRYRITFGFIGIYGFGGVYGGYTLNGKTVNETDNITSDETFKSLPDRIDYGYNFGAGLELFKKIQLGGTLSQGLKNTVSSIFNLPQPETATNRVVSVNLVYLF